jgi:hypothetical protein
LNTDSFLNFTFVSSVFYKFIDNSNKIFNNIDLTKDEITISKNFNDLNYSNFLDFLEYLSYINDNNSKRKEKINIIKNVLNIKYDNMEKDKILSELSKKIDFTMFSNKNLLVKLLSLQITNFLFTIYNLFILNIKDMETMSNEKIGKILAENLIEEEKLKNEFSKSEKVLKNENAKLKENINELKSNNSNFKKLEKEFSNLKLKFESLEKTSKLKYESLENSLKLTNEILAQKNNEFDIFRKNYEQDLVYFKEGYEFMKNLNYDILRRDAVKDLEIKNDGQSHFSKNDIDIEIGNKNFKKLVYAYLNDLDIQLKTQKNELELQKKINGLQKDELDKLKKIIELKKNL